MINLRDKSFKNNLTGEIVKVLDSFEDIAILEDKSRVDARHLVNPGLFTEITSQPIQSFNESIFNPIEVEEVKPENFFSNQGAYNSLADKIKNIPQHLIKDDPNAGQTSVRIEDPEGNPTTTAFDNAVRVPTNESAVIQVNPEDERAALAAKYGVVNPAESINKQNEAFAKLLGEDTPPDEEVQVIQVNREESEEVIQRFEVNGNQQEEYKREYIQQPIVEDPIIRMFKGVKRSLDFNVSIDIDNKIPRVDFIEMMEDSYETSIIDFLADEFTNNIVSNPQMIKEMIKTKINEVVYGKQEVNSQITDSVTQKSPTQVNDQITDSVTQGNVENGKPKTKRPRAPRKKKEEVK
jgi:hypothetical protein